MPDRSLDTLQLHACVDRLQAGDPAGADDLLRAAGDRLARLARKMLRGYATARRLADTGDVVQAAVIRLLRALTVVRPDSTRSFFNLAAVQMRRELADLSRRVAARPDLAGSPPPESCDSIEVSEDAADLELWGRFHEAVEELPAEERVLAVGRSAGRPIAGPPR
jgi:RNA polymerase sigma factor (sigma-70 family)